MRDLAIDPETGDLVLESGRARLTTSEDGENVAQRLRIRLRLWRGEYLLDRRVGIPYQDLLGRKGALPAFDATLRRAVATCPGIATLRAFTAALDRDRRARVTLSAQTTSGDPVDLGGFIAAGG